MHREYDARDYLTTEDIQSQFPSLTILLYMSRAEDPKTWGLHKKAGAGMPRLGQAWRRWTLVCSINKIIAKANEMFGKDADGNDQGFDPDQIYLYYDYRESHNWVNWELINTASGEVEHRIPLKDLRNSSREKTK